MANKQNYTLALTLWETRAITAYMGVLKTGGEDVGSIDLDTPAEEITQTMFDQSIGSVLVEENRV